MGSQSRVDNLQMEPGVLPDLQLISRQQRSIFLEEMATWQGRLCAAQRFRASTAIEVT